MTGKELIVTEEGDLNLLVSRKEEESILNHKCPKCGKPLKKVFNNRFVVYKCEKCNWSIQVKNKNQWIVNLENLHCYACNANLGDYIFQITQQRGEIVEHIITRKKGLLIRCPRCNVECVIDLETIH
ncbi:hypothetical protein [Thermodesulfovibrio hydrogeniphilus]